MRRRDAIVLIGSAALSGTINHAAAQQSGRSADVQKARVGMLCQAKCEGPGYSAFDNELAKLGWVEGQNLVTERRGAEGRYDRLPELAAELVRTKPNLIIAAATQSAIAAQNATSDIPVVFSFVLDPVAIGLVKSLAHPGGNATGVTAIEPGGLIGKQLDLIRELLPKAQRIAVLVNAQAQTARNSLTIEARSAAARMGLQIDAIEVRSVQDATDEVERVKARGADALLVIPDPIFNTVPNRIPDLVARLVFPAIYGQREMVQAGGLMSYGADLIAIARRHAHLVDRVLRGAHPSEIPVEQPTRYDFVINLKTAKALGLTIPPTLLARADEVIE